jgi:hypothetical protein
MISLLPLRLELVACILLLPYLSHEVGLLIVQVLFFDDISVAPLGACGWKTALLA